MPRSLDGFAPPHAFLKRYIWGASGSLSGELSSLNSLLMNVLDCCGQHLNQILWQGHEVDGKPGLPK